MKTYARIESGVVRELFECPDITGLFHPDLIWVECTGQSVTEGMLYDGGSQTFSAAPEPTPDPTAAQATLREAAQVALDNSDKTLLRCYEAGVAVPAELATYRGQLRGIVSGTSAATELPMRPEYPAGT